VLQLIFFEGCAVSFYACNQVIKRNTYVHSTCIKKHRNFFSFSSNRRVKYYDLIGKVVNSKNCTLSVHILLFSFLKYRF
jgi:hypothetical protein